MLKEVKKGDIITMDVGENLEWIGYAIVDQSMRIMGGLTPVKSEHVPVRVFDSSNISAGRLELHGRLGQLVRQRLPEALGPEVAVADDAAQPRLEARGLTKSFGGTQALRGVDLTLLPGEVHGLLGENGSGKSTLIKILAGFHAPDAGELWIDGEAVRLPLATGQFRELGMSFVHQHLGLVESLSVLENLRVADIASSRSRFGISWRQRAARARARRSSATACGSTRAPIVADLKPVERALLAIVRAIEEIRSVGRGHGVLVLDEPTVFLPREGIERLFSLVRDAAAAGASILFVSHDLDEVREITDRVTVLRDGALVGTVVTAETSETQFVEMIIGRRLAAMPRVRAPRPLGQARRRLRGRASAAARCATSRSSCTRARSSA